MKKTIIFLSGFAVPKLLTKSPILFDESSWKDYRTIFYQSKVPESGLMIERELWALSQIIKDWSYSSDVFLLGHSLGAWWAAGLACLPQFTAKKMALWTPLGIAGVFPIFEVPLEREPLNQKPNPNIVGPDKCLVAYAKRDLIVPYRAHAIPLADKFQAASFSLNGGHVWQSNHKEGLNLMKDWFDS